ncbi:hypothetical protein [Haliangium ochraceum]|uniref:Uncharacterized protein n=1 Tax=Haliangium ochraceum (strain DSM 14365 / JCM 11303 / SMP-2) TaxID=502025 RepID=D0LHY9_HALO1|nr:hypothetical protein [Haliangium ochraceum]ACY14818.1 hypothetical protein Hoch_2275 [Haliangium ochraceum DSM 14365]
MQSIGLLLIVLGCLAASLVAVLEPEAIAWGYFAPCLLAGVVGVVLVQVALRRSATASLGSNAQVLESSLGTIVSNLEALVRDAGDPDRCDPYALPARIDATFRSDIEAFVGARQAISYLWGMRAYGDVMSHFAAGERYLNRVWSSAADGYVDEATTYVARSRDQFVVALDKLRALAAAKSNNQSNSKSGTAQPAGAAP